MSPRAGGIVENLEVLNRAEMLAEKIQIKEDVVLFGVQHLTPTSVELFKRLIKKGLRPQNIYLMGKCYSANPINYYQLSQLGIQMAESSFYFDSHKAYDDLLKENIRVFFKKALQKIDFTKCRKIIVLDDGASLLSQKSFQFPKNVEIVGIEQTSGGYHIAKQSSIEFPIINVARSEAKLHYETPFIARMVCRKIKEHLKEIPFQIKKVLVLGSGFIGQAVSRYLSQNFEVDQIDVKDACYDPKKLEKRLKNYQLIIGCAGTPSITLKQLQEVRHPIALISASSSDREFPALELRKQIEPYSYFSRNIVVGNIHLINSGFPINFDDKFLDSKELELTRALLFTAVMQAALLKTLDSPSFIEVLHQKDIIETYLKNYPQTTHSSFCTERIQKEVNYPMVHQLLRGVTQNAFKDLQAKIEKGFSLAKTFFSPFGPHSPQKELQIA